MVEIKDRIIELRLSKDLTQSELAKELEISPSSIGMYEQGRRKPSFELLEKISDYFNVDMDYLMGRSDIKNKYQLEIKNKTMNANTGKEKLKEIKNEKISEQQLINTISNYLYENNKVTLGEIKRGNKVDVINSDKNIIATYDVELITKAYEEKYIKQQFSLEDIEEIVSKYKIPEELKGIARKQYIKFIGESAMFFDDKSISDETKAQILLSLQEVFYDAKERNKRKK